MPSPAERRALEWGCRAVALLGMALLLWQGLHPRPVPGAVPAASLDRALAEWTVSPAADTLQVTFDAPPGPAARDWLVALRRGGTAVRWANGGIVPLGLEWNAVPDPAGGVFVRVAGVPGMSVRVSDSLGTIDTLSLRGGGATLALGSAVGSVEARSGNTAVRVHGRVDLSTRRVVLLGMAGWEARFLRAALEERGWTVDARLALAPGLVAGTSPRLNLDTATTAVVIAVDSSAAPFATDIARFVDEGGGLVLLPEAAARSGFRKLRLAVPGTPTRAELRMIADRPLEALRVTPLEPVVAGAVVLDTRAGRPAVVAGRVGAGRVVQVGYQDTWRWRMMGGDDGPASHRAWWAWIVSSASRHGSGGVQAGDPAPLAGLSVALGPAGPLAAVPPARRDWWPWLVAVMMLGMLGEWTSRRLRGAA